MKPDVADGTTPVPTPAAREPKPLRAGSLNAAAAAAAGYPITARINRIAVLCATDIGGLIVSALAAYFIWALPVRSQSIRTYVGLLPVLSLFIAGYAQAGLYPGFGLGAVETLRRLSYVTGFGFLVLAIFPFILKLPPLYYSRVTFSVALALSLVLLPVGRMLVRRLARRWSWWAEPVVVIGTGDRAARAIRALQAEDQLGYRPVAVLSHRSPASGPLLESIPVRGGLDETPALAAQGVRVALVETDQLPDLAIVDRLQRDFHHVVLLRGYDDLPVEGIQIRNLGGIVGIEYTNNLLAHGNRLVKRAMDIVIGSLALVAAAPLIGLAALLVKALDGGPVFFAQRRSGLDGRPFVVTKIRTMRIDAERELEAHLAADPDLRDEWEATYKLKRDPRLIPVVGKVFRRFSIDELPQLWTVVQGRMSLVGPRPFPDYHLGKFPPPFLDLRQRVRPGITGLWQITVRSGGGIEKQQAYDTYYIRNWSVWLDLYLLSRTIAAVASGRGAY